MGLKEYQRKRKFSKTPEPRGTEIRKGRGPLRFVVQMHAASRLHYDLRIELDGVYKSWAVPKGPSLNPLDQRLAVFVEDHPLEYGSFEGIIPAGNYGAGTVMVWDSGTYRSRFSDSTDRQDQENLLREGLAKGHLTIVLQGEKLNGEFALIKLKRGEEKAWLLIKKRDEFSSIKRHQSVTDLDRSVKTGRSIEEIARVAASDGDVWVSKRVGGAVPASELQAAARARLKEKTVVSGPAERARARVRAVLKRKKGAAAPSQALLQERAAERLRAKLAALGGKPKSGAKQVREKAQVRVAARALSRPVSSVTQLHGARRVQLTHLDKVFWKAEGLTKGDLIDYYRQIAPVLVPHLRDRPESMHRHPHGIGDAGFFQKDLTGYYPRWLKTHRVFSGSSAKGAGRTINYLLCQDEDALLYMANLGCIELNPWISRVGSLEHPDYSVIDLDPDDSNTFEQVIEVARATHQILASIGAKSFCKTSGATGLHIVVPTVGKGYTYDQTREFAEAVCRAVHEKYPKITSVERNPARRRGRIYLDFLQNARGQTLAAPYCVRPRAGATVSTPLKWSEVRKGLSPEQFTIATVPARVKRVGDLWAGTRVTAVDLDASLRRLAKKRGVK